MLWIHPHEEDLTEKYLLYCDVVSIKVGFRNEMDNILSASIQELIKLLKREQSHAPIAFAIYRLLKDANIPDDDIQNIGAILTDIASGE